MKDSNILVEINPVSIMAGKDLKLEIATEGLSIGLNPGCSGIRKKPNDRQTFSREIL